MDRPSIGAEIACRRQDDRRSSDSAIRRDLAHTPVVSVQSVIVHEVFIRSAGRNLIDASHLMVELHRHARLFRSEHRDRSRTAASEEPQPERVHGMMVQKPEN